MITRLNQEAIRSITGFDSLHVYESFFRYSTKLCLPSIKVVKSHVWCAPAKSNVVEPTKLFI